MGGLLFGIVLFGVGLLFIKSTAKNPIVMISRMDYCGERTLFYSKIEIFFALLLLAVVAFAGVIAGDFATLYIILGLLIFVYSIFIAMYFLRKRKRELMKRTCIKIPARIVGVKQERSLDIVPSESSWGSVDTTRLIVQFVHPYTNNVVEHTTGLVTSHPFYALKSLNVTVYYQSDDVIWIDDFDRIKKNKENLAYQVTGNVQGKVPDTMLRKE